MEEISSQGMVVHTSREVCHYAKRSNLRYAHGITPKLVTSARVHLRGLPPGQHNSKKRRRGGCVRSDRARNLTQDFHGRYDSDVLFTTALIARCQHLTG